MKGNIIREIKQYISNNTPILLATRLKDGHQELFEINQDIDRSSIVPYKKVREIFNNGKSELIRINAEEWFLKVYNPGVKIIIVGAVHIAQPLINFSKIIGFRTIIIDPRDSFNHKNKFSNVKIYKDWPDSALKKITVDSNTAVVTLTHDPKLDDVALKFALKSRAFYIGSLGSKKTHESRVKRLKLMGFTNKQISRIHAPIGIKIYARSPSEIASSIISQIIMSVNKNRKSTNEI